MATTCRLSIRSVAGPARNVLWAILLLLAVRADAQQQVQVQQQQQQQGVALPQKAVAGGSSQQRAWITTDGKITFGNEPPKDGKQGQRKWRVAKYMVLGTQPAGQGQQAEQQQKVRCLLLLLVVSHFYNVRNQLLCSTREGP